MPGPPGIGTFAIPCQLAHELSTSAATSSSQTLPGPVADQISHRLIGHLLPVRTPPQRAAAVLRCRPCRPGHGAGVGATGPGITSGPGGGGGIGAGWPGRPMKGSRTGLLVVRVRRSRRGLQVRLNRCDVRAAHEFGQRFGGQQARRDRPHLYALHARRGDPAVLGVFVGQRCIGHPDPGDRGVLVPVRRVQPVLGVGDFLG